MREPTSYAALFIDFENLFYYVKNNLGDGMDAIDCVMGMLERLRKRIEENHGERCISQHAYADFERMEEGILSHLYLLGIDSHNVLGIERKSTADMQMCIDALQAMHTRQEIRTFVLLAGDRDYIPLIKHLNEHARHVLVCGFQGNLSRDLLKIAGEKFLIPAEELLPEGARLQPKRPAAAAKPAASKPQPQPKPAGFNDPRGLATDEREAVGVMLKYFGDKPEVWLTPYLHKLRDEMPLMAEFERKALITRLSDAGAIAVEKRNGEPHDYSVILVNWNHPDVQSTNPG